AVSEGELIFPAPYLAEKDVVVELGKLGSECAELIPPGCLFDCHCFCLHSLMQWFDGSIVAHPGGNVEYFVFMFEHSQNVSVPSGPAGRREKVLPGRRLGRTGQA